MHLLGDDLCYFLHKLYPLFPKKKKQNTACTMEKQLLKIVNVPLTAEKRYIID